MDSRDFLLTTDFPLDKVVYMDSGSVAVPTGSIATTEVSHNLPFRPMVIGTWSLDANFSTSIDEGIPQYADLNAPYLAMSSTPEFLRLTPYNVTGSTLTFYWRAYGFMPPNVNEVATFTSAEADDFVMNTDYSYSKLLDTGIVNLSSSSASVSHNLGYRPQVEVWGASTISSPVLVKHTFGTSSTDNMSNRITVSESSLNFIKGTAPTLEEAYYYRIYADEQ